MHRNYKLYEIVLKKIIQNNVTENKVKLIIYYTKFKTTNLVTCNNSSPQTSRLNKTNVVYKFKCSLEDCCLPKHENTYIGFTSTTLSRHLTLHMTDNSSISQHQKLHSCPHSNYRNILTENTHILHKEKKLQILEALYIKQYKPSFSKINFQCSTHILKCL